MKTLHYEEYLQKIFSNINEWLKFAEAKNFGLITLNAATVFGLSQTTFEANSTIKIVGFYVLTPFLFFSLFFSLISLFPILSKIEKGNKLKGILSWLSNFIDKEKKFENIHYFGYLRTLKKSQFISEFKLKTNSSEEFATYEVELVSQILYNSRIAWLKYQLFKIAGFFTLVGIIISPFALFFLEWIK